MIEGTPTPEAIEAGREIIKILTIGGFSLGVLTAAGILLIERLTGKEILKSPKR